MTEFTVEMLGLNHRAIVLQQSVTLRPRIWGWHSIGGCEFAEIDVIAPELALWDTLRLLRHGVVIRNQHRTPVWWGYVHEATVSVDGLTTGISLENMANTVTVLYTYDAPGGGTLSGETEPDSDSASIQRYGTKELFHSMGNTSETGAQNRRDIMVDALKNPTPWVSPGEGEMRGTLLCRGWWDTLSWTYYTQDAGLEQYTDTASDTVPMGLGFTDTTIGFHHYDEQIHDLTGRLQEFKKDYVVEVAGSTSNDGSHTIESGTSEDAVTYAASTISFDAADDILDSANELGFCNKNDLISISGSTGGTNDGYWLVKSSQTDHVTVSPNSISTQSTGPTVTIKRGNSLETTSSLTDENPSASITLTAHGERVAQSFTLSHNANWTLNEIVVRLAKSNNVVTDSVQVQIMTSVGGVPTVELDSATVSASDLTDQMSWITFVMPSDVTLTYGNTYWIVLSRTGSNDPNDYYQVGVNEDGGYTGGALKVYTGSAYTDRVPDADLSFQVWGKQATDEQIEDVLDTGQFFSAVEVDDTSGIDTKQYRSAIETARDVVEELMEIGTTGSARYVSEVTVDRRCRVYEEPAYSRDSATVLTRDGTFTNAMGALLEPGKAALGWVRLAASIPALDAIASVSPIYIEQAEFDAETGEIHWTPRGASSPWELTEVRNR